MLRVVRPGGYFVYADLLLPAWLAALGTKAIKSVGFPTAATLEQITTAHGFSPIHRKRSLFLVDAVYRKDTNA